MSPKENETNEAQVNDRKVALFRNTFVTVLWCFCAFFLIFPPLYAICTREQKRQQETTMTCSYIFNISDVEFNLTTLNVNLIVRNISAKNVSAVAFMGFNTTALNVTLMTRNFAANNVSVVAFLDDSKPLQRLASYPVSEKMNSSSCF